jgi:hypothetical protein
MSPSGAFVRLSDEAIVAVVVSSQIGLWSSLPRSVAAVVRLAMVTPNLIIGEYIRTVS